MLSSDQQKLIENALTDKATGDAIAEGINGVQAAAAIEPLVPGTATAEQCATAINAIIAALAGSLQS